MMSRKFLDAPYDVFQSRCCVTTGRLMRANTALIDQERIVTILF